MIIILEHLYSKTYNCFWILPAAVIHHPRSLALALGLVLVYAVVTVDLVAGCDLCEGEEGNIIIAKDR
jgi:hypothetical protein